MTNRKIEYWVIPPEADGEFVANMEEVLDTYGKPYDSSCPVICMDEQPVRLINETRQCIHGRRIGEIKTLRAEINAWSRDVNDTQRGVDWQMKVDDARCKLKSGYPKIRL